MAIAIEQSIDAQANSTTHSVTFASAPAEGEVIVLFFAYAKDLPSVTLTEPSGFTVLWGNAFGGDPFIVHECAYKVAGASEGTTYEYTTSGSARSTLMGIVFSGVDTGETPTGSSFDSATTFDEIPASGHPASGGFRLNHGAIHGTGNTFTSHGTGTLLLEEQVTAGSSNVRHYASTSYSSSSYTVTKSGFLAAVWGYIILTEATAGSTRNRILLT